jgi:hypothetical protein
MYHTSANPGLLQHNQMEFGRQVGVGLEPLVSSLIMNREFAHLVTAGKIG